MLTISQVAGFVGITVRAVRHYHARGLLAEPDRDVSGYRRYDSQAVIDLIRIRTLADAGVPLARVRELLRSDPDDFARAVEEVDRELQERIGALQENRTRIRRLAGGDSLVLPVEAVTYLTRLRELGLSERTITMERDAWIVLAAQAPDRVPGWIQHKQEFLDDPQHRALYLDFDRAYDWQPDDPRLAALAHAMHTYVKDEDPQSHGPAPTSTEEAGIDGTLVAMVQYETVTASPAWRRLTQLLEEEAARQRG